MDYFKLKAEWASCKKCSLCKSRKQIVFSVGPENARLMIVAESPGATEDITGVPLTGPTGLLLNKILASVDIKREDCYLANAIRCCPAKGSKPNQKQIDTCSLILQEEIKHVKPKVILILGSISANSLLGVRDGIGSVVGKTIEKDGIKHVICYHPAAILHTSTIDKDKCMMYKRVTYKAVKEVKKILDSLPREQEQSFASFKLEGI